MTFHDETDPDDLHGTLPERSLPQHTDATVLMNHMTGNSTAIFGRRAEHINLNRWLAQTTHLLMASFRSHVSWVVLHRLGSTAATCICGGLKKCSHILAELLGKSRCVLRGCVGLGVMSHAYHLALIPRAQTTLRCCLLLCIGTSGATDSGGRVCDDKDLGYQYCISFHCTLEQVAMLTLRPARWSHEGSSGCKFHHLGQLASLQENRLAFVKISGAFLRNALLNMFSLHGSETPAPSDGWLTVGGLRRTSYVVTSTQARKILFLEVQTMMEVTRKSVIPSSILVPPATLCFMVRTISVWV